jgi:7,8-dihydropterin-6-yl-methyl-4-(beta-D-ribofuranosyl)aminobenzene 5'-phosphate synthase
VLKVTVVVSDEPPLDPKLRSGPGFAALVEEGRHRVLFDTGPDPDLLLHNLEGLGYGPEDLTAVVISHNHWDHTGGLRAVESEVARIVTPERIGVKNELVREEWLGIGDMVLTDVLEGPPPERALYANGLLITGCAHPGIHGFVEWCVRRGLEVHTVLGGLHLMGATEIEVEKVADRLEELGVKIAGPCHCSGEVAKRVFRRRFEFLNVGPGLEVRV